MPKPQDTDWSDDLTDEDIRVLSDDEASKFKHDIALEPSPNDAAELKRQIDKDRKEKRRRW